MGREPQPRVKCLAPLSLAVVGLFLWGSGLKPYSGEHIRSSAPKFLRAVSAEELESLPSGWFWVILGLAEEGEDFICSLPKEDQDAYYAVQIKEKLATLRVYLNRPHPRLLEIIHKAELRCEELCHKCDKKGCLRVTSRNYLYRSCSEHKLPDTLKILDDEQ